MAVQMPQKIYFRIGEVARILEVATHVIRFWESEFRGLRPQKSRAGQRIYSRKDVERLAAIKRLLREERYTIEGARKALREKGLEPPAEATTPELDRAETLREALLSARGRLTALLASLPSSSGG